MAGEAIIGKLQGRKYAGLDADIKAYLHPCLSIPPAVPARSQHGYFALKFLHSYASQFEQIAASQGANAVDVALTCHSVLKLCPPDLKEPLTVEKFLYHLLSKALKAGYFGEAVQVADLLFVDLLECPPEGIINIACGSYVALWNGTLQHEQNNRADCLLSFKLRQAALKMLLLSNKPHSLVLERLMVTHDKFERETASNKAGGVNKHTVQELLNKLYTEISIHFCNIFVVDVAEASCMCAYVELQLRHCKLLTSAVECTQLLEDLRSVLKKFTKRNSIKGPVCSAWDLSVKLMELACDFRTLSANKLSSKVASKLLALTSSCNEVYKELDGCSYLQLQELSLLNKCGLFVYHESLDWNGKLGGDLQATLFEMQGHIGATLAMEEKLLLRSSDVCQARLRNIRLEYSRLKLLRFKMLHNKLQDSKDFTSPESRQFLETSYMEMCRHSVWLEKLIPSTFSREDSLQLELCLYRFARTYYSNKGDHKAVVTLLSQCVAWLDKWRTDVAPSQEKIAQYQVWKRYEILADAQRRRGHLKEALVAVTNGLLADSSHVNNAAEMWIRIKGEMVKSKMAGTDLTRTLWSSLKGKGTSLREENILTAEFSAAKSARWKSYEVQLCVLEDLLLVTKQNGERAALLLEKTCALWTSRLQDDTVALQCCQEAIELLEALLAKQKTRDPGTQDDLARAYLWRHIMEDVDPKQTQLRMLPDERNDASTNASSDSEDPKNFQDCVTIGMEQEALQMANKALHIWETLFASEPSVTGLRCVQSTIDGIAVLAAIYRLAQKNLYELRALQLLGRLVQSADLHHHYLQVQTHMIEFYCRLKQPNLAVAVVMATEEWLSGRSKLRSGQPYIWYLQARARVHLLRNQVEEGLVVLRKATTLKADLLKDKTKDALFLDGSLRQLQALYSGLPHLYESESYGLPTQPTGDSGIEMQVAGTRSLSGVVCFLLGEWLVTGSNAEDASNKAPDNTLDKWSTLAVLLDSLLDTGSLFVELGDAREARCFLQQGLKIAQAFLLPRRFAAFHLALARLDAVSGHYSDFSAHMHTINYVLNQVSPNKLPTKKAKSSHRSSDANKASGFESEDEEFELIKTRKLELDEELTPLDRVSGCESPRLQRKALDTPHHWKHSAECDCIRCEDMVADRLQYGAFALEAEKLRLEGAGVKANSYWHRILRHQDQLTDKVEQHLVATAPHSLHNSVVSASKKTTGFTVHEDQPSAQPVSSYYQDILVDVCLGLTEFALHNENHDLYELWSQKAMELLDVERYPWMITSHSKLARAIYLTAVPVLLPTTHTDVSKDLAAEISRLSICEPPKMTTVPQTPANPARPPKFPTRRMVARNKTSKKSDKTPEQGDKDLSDLEIKECEKSSMQNHLSNVGKSLHNISPVESNVLNSSNDTLQTPAASTTSRSTKLHPREVTYGKPKARNLHKENTISEENGLEEIDGVNLKVDKSVINSAYKAMAQKKQNKTTECDSPCVNPGSVNTLLSTKLDRLLDSLSDDEDNEPDMKRRMARKNMKIANKPASMRKVTEDRALTCLSPNINSGRVRTKDQKINLLSGRKVVNSHNKNTSKKLLKSSTCKSVQNNDENVYDFNTSDDESRLQKTKTKPGNGKTSKLKTKRSAANDKCATIEVAWDGPDKSAYESMDSSVHRASPAEDSKHLETAVKSKPRTKASTQKSKAAPDRPPVRRGRLTRAKAGNMEDNRNDSDGDICCSNLDGSLYMPDGESDEEERLVDTEPIYSPLAYKHTATVNPREQPLTVEEENELEIELPRREVDPKLRRRVSDLEYSDLNEDELADMMLMDDTYVDDSYTEHSSVSLLELYGSTPDKEDIGQAVAIMEEVLASVGHRVYTDSERQALRVPLPHPPTLQLVQSPVQHGQLFPIDQGALAVSSGSQSPVAFENPLYITRVLNLSCGQSPEHHARPAGHSEDLSEQLSEQNPQDIICLSPSDPDLVSHLQADGEVMEMTSPTLATSDPINGTGDNGDPREASSLADPHCGRGLPIGSRYYEPIETFRAGSDDESMQGKPKQKARAKPSKPRKTKPESSEPELPRASQARSSLSGVCGITEPVALPDGIVSAKSTSDAAVAISQLERAYNLLKHQPVTCAYRDVCQSLGLDAMKSDPWKAAFYFTEGHAITFRHQALINATRKLRKLGKEESSSSGTMTDLSADSQRNKLIQTRTMLTFNKSVDDLMSMVEDFPEDVAVCQVSVSKPPSRHGNQMIVTRFLQGKSPVVINCPGFATVEGQQVLSNFQAVMNSSRETMALKVVVEWWMQREDLDEKLMDLLSQLEHRWLGSWRGILQGVPENAEDVSSINKAASHLHALIRKLATRDVDEQKLKILLSCGHTLRTEDLMSTFHELTQLDLASDELKNIVLTFQRSCKKMNLEGCQRKPVCLLLDKEIQHLPWESIPILREQPVTRMPSLHFLAASLATLKEDSGGEGMAKAIDPRSTFYILNPENNLATTQETFKSWFQKEAGWRGVIGEPPTTEQYKDAIVNHDVLIYCGHGSGRKFFSGDSLQQQWCRAVVLLMGCSSGKLTAEGQLEAAGMMLNYCLAGCPCVVANLWDVTDRDIDRYLDELLKKWLKSPQAPSLINVVQQSRTKCRLPYLIGAAPVVYGLPLNIYPKRH